MKKTVVSELKKLSRQELLQLLLQKDQEVERLEKAQELRLRELAELSARASFLAANK